MLTKILRFIANPADVRTIAAIVLGVLTTILGHSVEVKSVVDGIAGLIVAIDLFQIHKGTQQAAERSAQRAAAAVAAAVAGTQGTAAPVVQHPAAAPPPHSTPTPAA